MSGEYICVECGNRITSVTREVQNGLVCEKCFDEMTNPLPDLMVGDVVVTTNPRGKSVIDRMEMSVAVKRADLKRDLLAIIIDSGEVITRITRAGVVIWERK